MTAAARQLRAARGRRAVRLDAGASRSSSAAPPFPEDALRLYLRELLSVGRAITHAVQTHVIPELEQASASSSRRRNDAANRPRLAIVGGPGVGKTSLARALAARHDLPVRHSDDLIGRGWSQASEQLAGELMQSQGGIFEGVAMARALRKALEASSARPVDLLVRLRAPLESRSPAQLAMTTGHDSILEPLLPELARRGVEVITASDEAEALERLDELDARRRLDERSASDRIDRAFRRAERSLRVIDVRPTLQRVALRTSEHARSVLEQQIAEALGVPSYTLQVPAQASPRQDAKQQVTAVDPFDAKSGIGLELDRFVRDNVRRVRGMTNNALLRAKSTVREGLGKGLRPNELAAKLMQRLPSLTEDQATVIANHSVGTFHAKQTELRQTALGVTQYRWATAGDAKVRPGHRALEGTVQSWDKPPVVNPKTGKRAHPGFDTNYYACRCQALPIIDPATIAPPPGSRFARGAPAPGEQPLLPGVRQTRRIEVIAEPPAPPRGAEPPLVEPAPRRPSPRPPSEATPIITLTVKIPPPSAAAIERDEVMHTLSTLTQQWPSRGLVDGTEMHTALRSVLAGDGLAAGQVGGDARIAIQHSIANRPELDAVRSRATGHMQLRGDVAARARAGLEQLAEGKAANNEQLGAVKSLMRAELAAAGPPSTVASLPNTGGWLAEELATEVNARRLTRELAGLDAAGLPDRHALALPSERAGRYLARSEQRPGDKWVASTMQALRRSTGWDRQTLVNALETAAREFKRTTRPLTSGREALERLVDAIPQLAPAQRAQLIAELDNPQQLLEDWVLKP